jgi:hypothetical protein
LTGVLAALPDTSPADVALEQFALCAAAQGSRAWLTLTRHLDNKVTRTYNRGKPKGRTP